MAGGKLYSPYIAAFRLGLEVYNLGNAPRYSEDPSVLGNGVNVQSPRRVASHVKLGVRPRTLTRCRKSGT
jgi:hypothetical protein